MSRRLRAAFFLAAALAVNAFASPAPNPELVCKAGCDALRVDGKPFTLLGAQA